MDEEKPLTRRDATTLARRQHLVLSAAHCFIEKGFHQTSTRDIARQAGVSLGNLYNHFASKSDLIAEIAALEADELRGMEHALAGDALPARAVSDFAAAYFDHASRPENAVLAAEITAEAMRNPETADGFVQNQARLLDRLSALLRQAHDDGVMRLDDDPDDVAALLLDLAESAALRVAFTSKAEKRRTRASVLRAVRKLTGMR